METQELFSTSPESILIVNRRGLKRLKCPFAVLLVVAIEDLEEGMAYEVRLIFPHSHFKIVYVITGGEKRFIELEESRHMELSLSIEEIKGLIVKYKMMIKDIQIKNPTG